MGIDELSRFLAGLPARSDLNDSPVLNREACWREHAQDLDGLFGQFNARHARPFTRWAEQHMGALREIGAVLYPFSGPDFIFAHLLYPQAGTYLLCGLESCEMLPPWESLAEAEITEALRGIVSGISHFLRHTYFITKDMRQAFHSTRLHGVLPALLVFLARSGHAVESVEPVDLDPQGNPVLPGKPPAAGLRINFRVGGQPRRLFYFQQDLRDGHCPPDHPFLLFADSLGCPAVFAKSASYLLHEAYFSHLRELIFTRCAALVQDPSSLPYRSFAQRGWRVDLHGHYVCTLPVFRRYEQPDLAEVCQSGSEEMSSLDFGIGYLTDPETASLMIATPLAG